MCVPPTLEVFLHSPLGAIFGRVPLDLPDPPTFYIFFEISFSSYHWAFSHFHVASHDWTTWQPTIGPRQPTVQSPATSTYELPHQCAKSTCHVTICSTTWLYGLPRGTFLLVHGMTQKCQKWGTCGSLWCCHITMLTSCWCQHDTCHLLHVPRMVYGCWRHSYWCWR